MKLFQVGEPLEAVTCNLSGSTFTDVNLSGTKIENVNLAGTTITNANLSGMSITNVNLAGTSITDCALDGMTINGIRVTDLFASYLVTQAMAANANVARPA